MYDIDVVIFVLELSPHTFGELMQRVVVNY